MANKNEPVTLRCPYETSCPAVMVEDDGKIILTDDDVRIELSPDQFEMMKRVVSDQRNKLGS